MRRIVVRKPGGHDALELVEGPDPQVAAGQVRVAVRAAGVNYADAIVRMGYYEAAKGQYPITPGFEFSGLVDAVGAGVSGFKEGDRVFGFTRFGGYASSIAVAANQLYPCPEGWDFPECAGFPAVFLTAHIALFQKARVEAGETVLVHSAAGGVGTALLQLARVAGCRPIAVVGAAHKVALCRELGADAVIDRSSEDLWPAIDRLAPKGFDAVFDSNGISTLRQGFDRLVNGGRLVVYGFADIVPRGKDKPNIVSLAYNYLRVPKFSPLDMTATNRSLIGFNVVFMFDRLDKAVKGMTDMLGWIRDGRIKKAPVTLFPLERAADAHRAIESGTTTGKLILTVQ